MQIFESDDRRLLKLEGGENNSDRAILHGNHFALISSRSKIAWPLRHNNTELRSPGKYWNSWSVGSRIAFRRFPRESRLPGLKLNFEENNWIIRKTNEQKKKKLTLLEKREHYNDFDYYPLQRSFIYINNRYCVLASPLQSHCSEIFIIKFYF